MVAPTSQLHKDFNCVKKLIPRLPDGSTCPFVGPAGRYGLSITSSGQQAAKAFAETAFRLAWIRARQSRRFIAIDCCRRDARTLEAHRALRRARLQPATVFRVGGCARRGFISFHFAWRSRFIGA